MAIVPAATKAPDGLQRATTSENRAIVQHVAEIHHATGGKETWRWDNAADRDDRLLLWLRQGVACVIRQRGDRQVRGEDGRLPSVAAWAETWRPARGPRPWPKQGYSSGGRVWLPEDPEHELLLVVPWRRPGGEPLWLLVSPAARRQGRTAAWLAKAYCRRWGVEEATWGIKQRFYLEA